MVAIALYKGFLRRLPDVPRIWTMPTRQISFKDFKNLQRRRSKALTRLTSSTATTSVNPSLNQDAEPEILVSKDGRGEIGGVEVGKRLENGAVVIATCSEAVDGNNTSVESRIDDMGTEENLVMDDSVAKVVEDQKEMEMEREVVTVVPSERMKNKDSITDEGKRKKELEEKLHMLKGKRHRLVHALKQILNAEEVKRAEPEDSFNQNADTRQFMESIVPLSPNIPHLGRTVSVASGCPSRFVQFGHQGHPSVPVSGTNYVSPSPAASGGTSSFRDNNWT